MDKQQLESAIHSGWRVSPLATAVTLTSRAGGEQFEPAAHLRILSDAIVDTVNTSGRLIVTVPPSHGKSMLISTYTPVWYLENWPNKIVFNCGYGAEFAARWGKKVRDLIVETHKDSLTVRLRDDSKAAERWETTAGGGMLTTGVGGPLTGHHGDLVIIDDPIKNWKEASSWPTREDHKRWYTSTVRTRLKPGAAIIVVLTRWNEDDLAGWLLREMAEDWCLIQFPAIYDEKAALAGPDPLGRKIGEALWPERYPVKELMVHMRGSLEVWESLYQQRPGGTAGLGNVYQAFKETMHVRTRMRDPGLPLVWSLDFNRAPFCTTISQYKEYYGPRSHLTNEKFAMVDVLDELCVDDIGTEAMCDAFLERAREIVGSEKTVLEIYGDPAAAAKHTSQVVGTDYDIIRHFFRNEKQFDVRMNVARKAPAIKDRVNTMNGMLMNALGECKMYIDPKCKKLIKDFSNVMWLRDSNGRTTGSLDKSEKSLTHVSDAHGYFIHRKFALKSANSGEQPGIAQ